MNLCPDSRDDGSRCEKCPLNRLDAAQHSEAGQLLRRALDLRTALKLGITVGMEEIAADEFYAMLAVEEAQDQSERERVEKS